MRKSGKHKMPFCCRNYEFNDYYHYCYYMMNWMNAYKWSFNNLMIWLRVVPYFFRCYIPRNYTVTTVRNIPTSMKTCISIGYSQQACTRTTNTKPSRLFELYKHFIQILTIYVSDSIDIKCDKEIGIKWCDSPKWCVA